MAYTIIFEPAGIRLLCEEPLTAADAARTAGLSIRSECGGKTVCGKCLVRLEQDHPSSITEAEKNHLTASQADAGWRLACCIVLSSDAVVYIPPSSQTERQVIQTEGISLSFSPEPAVQVLNLAVSPAILDDQSSDLTRVSKALYDNYGIQGAWAGLPALGALRQALRAGNWRISLALHGSEIIAAYPQDAVRPLGLAVDVGTTKLACYLVDLITGQVLAVAGGMNPQIAYGEDVMSRLEAVMREPANVGRLQNDVIDTINTAALQMCASQGLRPEHILDVCLVGNTAMHHLFTGLPARPLAVAPFVPALTSALEVDADRLGLQAAPGAHAYLPPPIAGFVGSDHLAFLCAAGFGEDQRTRMGIDIGTNTEIALQAGGRIVSCSTASGPAFEGAHILHGMRAALGAIQRVVIQTDSTAYCDVIGGGPAMGICGSGILDAVAELRRAGLIDVRGRMQPTTADCMQSAMADRIQPDVSGIQQRADGTLFYTLVAGSNGNRDVTITQHDVDQILLAKGAIRAGIDILLHHFNLEADDLEEIVIAGAFGSFLDPFNAMRIGLLPAVPLSRVHAVGNAAGSGARLLLASTGQRRRAEALAARIEYLELTLVPGFNRYFAQGVRLPAV
jgi:uncharacterized 2Fe-2S/4Fe-4S cluster protein (DUF4445 family)